MTTATDKPEIIYRKGKGGAITSARINGEFHRLRTDRDWERLDAKLAAMGWTYSQERDDLIPIR